MAKAPADFLVLKSPTLAPDAVFHTPEGVSDAVASTLQVAGLTAAAALSAIALRAGDTVLIGAAAGGVGIFAVQLAKLAGARVTGPLRRAPSNSYDRLAPSPSSTAQGSPTGCGRWFRAA